MRDTGSHVRLPALATFCAAVLTACGGDDGPAANLTPSSGKKSGNSPPQLTGAPHTVVLQGTPYSFAPSANDADGHALTFSIENPPRWATFNANTGSLTGTPSPADVGQYSDIRISVSDGQSTVSLAPFQVTVTAVATGAVTLSWLPPTQNTDGTPLANLRGYRVYWGTTEGTYLSSTTLENPGLASYVVEQLTPGRWFFVVTAISVAGAESGFSNVGTTTVP